MSWERHKLIEICTKVTDGTHDSPKSILKGYPYVKGLLVKKGRIDFDNCEFLSEQDHLKVISRSKAEKGDVLFANIGINVGECAYVNVDFEFSIKNLALFKPKFEILNGRFLYFLLSSEYVQTEIKNKKSGSAQPFLSLETLRNHIIEIPPLETQKRIASILSTYDDLIENNLKRIKLLEETAQNIYKEWFVNFRFPNYEHTEFDVESGLPVEWDVLAVKDYCNIVSRGSTLDYNGDEALIPVLNQSCVRNGELELERIRYACPLKENKEYSYLKLNDILINSMGDGTLGRVSKNNTIEDRYIIHNCITFLRAKNNYSQPMLYGYISSKQDYFITVAQGSTGQSTLNLKLINELKINVPTKIIIDAFDKIILPMWQTIGTLKTTNQNLKEARDILLPRLMNRTIAV